jgi:hypothetical protein
MVGGFLPQSIADWASAWPVSRQVDLWLDAGIENVWVRKMFFGTAVLMVGRKRGG